MQGRLGGLEETKDANELRGSSVSLTRNGNVRADPPEFCSSDFQLRLNTGFLRIDRQDQENTK